METVEEVGTKHCHNEGHSALSGKRQFFSCYYYWRVFCELSPGPPWHWGTGPGLKREIKIQTSLELKPNWLALTTQGIWATLAMLWHSVTVYLKIMNALDVSCGGYYLLSPSSSLCEIQRAWCPMSMSYDTHRAWVYYDIAFRNLMSWVSEPLI